MCRKVFSGEFIGQVTGPHFKWICEDCLAEGQDSFRFPPLADPARFAELKTVKTFGRMAAPSFEECHPL